MTDPEPDLFASCTTVTERLAVELSLITETDNTAKPEDGPQPPEVAG